MKRLSKILMLVLVVALSLGCVFAIASSAADEATGVTVQSDVNFTGATTFPWQDAHNHGVVGVYSSVGGNSYFEWTFYTAPGQQNDTRYQSFPSVYQFEYYVIEFDIATKTVLPDNFGLHMLCASKDPVTGTVSNEGAGIYSPIIVTAGQLTSGGKVIPANENSDWTHISIVVDGVQLEKTVEYTDANGMPATKTYTSYDDSVVKVYADGVLINTETPWAGKNVYQDRRSYIGWNYKGTTPVEAGESVAIDNWYQASCREYLGTEEADLSMLFGENGITNLADYKGTELRFNANGYTYPENLGNVYVASPNGNVMYGTLQDAINDIANLKVEGDIHLINAEGVVAADGSFTGLPSAKITVPVTIYTHGKAVAQPTVAGAVIETVGQDDIGDTVYTYKADAQSVTFEYYPTYDDCYNMTNVMSRVDIKVGETPTAPVVKNVYDKATGKVTLFQGWNYYVYDADGNETNLGTELPAFTEADYGTVYCAVAVTEVKDALFWTVNGEDITYYGSAAEFTNANLTGKTVVLGGNVVATETLHNVKIDLNGYTLASSAINLFVGGYVYSSAEGGTLINGGNLHAADAGDKLYLGYITDTAKSEYRIKLVINLIASARNDQTFMYGCDVFTTYEWTSAAKNGGGLFNNQNSRVKVVDIDNCNFYCGTYTHLLTQHAMTGTYNVNIKNTNFYGKGSLICPVIYSTSEGATTVNLENVHTYGEFQMVGSNTFKLNVGVGCSFANYNAQNVKSIAAGYWVKATDAKVTLADQTYVKTIGGETFTFAGGEFAVGNVVELAPVMATFNFYDVDIADVVTATPKLTVTKYIGETPTAPILASKKEGGKFYNCTGWVVYNSNFEVVGELGAVTQEMNGQTYYCCPVWAEVEPAFAVVNGDVESMCAASDFNATFLAGKSVKLYSDIVYTASDLLSNVTIDLNGYSLSSTKAIISAIGKCYVYNSNLETSGRLETTGSLVSGGEGARVYIGYSASGVKGEGRITMSVDGMIVDNRNFEAYLYNVDYVGRVSRGTRNALFLCSWGRTSNINIEGCNFYCVGTTNFIRGDQANSSINITVKDTKIYGSGRFVDVLDKVTSGGQIRLDNVQIYGDFLFQVWEPYWMTVTVTEDCVFSNPNRTITGTVVAPEGMVLVPNTENVTLDQTFVMADGTIVEMKGEYAAAWKLGTPEEKDAFVKAVVASSYRNVNLDVNINYNIYIPATYTVAGATEKVTINNVEYWVVTFATAPKDAYAAKNAVTVNVNGLDIEFNASVVSYANALLNVASESEYAVASKAMVKYVLNYIKTVAVAANAEADVAAISALLGEFALTDADKVVTGAIENVVTINGVTGVALELNSAVGMVVRVAKDYVGTISVSIAGAETVTAEYTEAAEEDRYIVIGDIEIFNFTNDVVVTNGTETMTYNLATYVENVKTDVAYATYAYAVQAKAYHTAFGAPNTID